MNSPVLRALLILVGGYAAVSPTTTSAGAPLSRQQAVAALLDPASGVRLDLDPIAVWCPFVDFGAGPGFEGLLPAGSGVAPPANDEDPLPGSSMCVDADSFFFWIDDSPPARFVHSTRFALVYADQANPTVFNGGIKITYQEWWPEITLPGAEPKAFFHLLTEQTTLFPPGFDNPDGLIAGSALDPSDLEGAPAAAPQNLLGGAANPNENACAILLHGDSRKDFLADVDRWEQELKDAGVKPTRIIRSKKGKPASKKDVLKAFKDICKWNPPCDPIYIRISTHGTKLGALKFKPKNGVSKSFTRGELCNKFKKFIVPKDVRIHLIVDACNSGKILNPLNWNFPGGSTILTSADRGQKARGGRYKDGIVPFTGGIFSYALDKCRKEDLNEDGVLDADADGNGSVDDCEAYEWLLDRKPCYVWQSDNKTRRYPGGAPPGVNLKKRQSLRPQKRVVLDDPEKLNINVCNNTTSPKTDFHIIFRGKVQDGGVAKAWRSDATDDIGDRWAENGVTISYDSRKNKTTVWFEDTNDPIQPGQYVHFGYALRKGLLAPIRKFWTPSSTPAANSDTVPIPRAMRKKRSNGRGFTVGLESIDSILEAPNVPVEVDLFYRLSPVDIPLDNLNLGDPLVSGLPANPLGTFVVQPNDHVEFEVFDTIQDGDILILEAHTSWSLNPNVTIQLQAFEPFEVLPPDCNFNGVDDDQDIALGTSPDANNNQIPDECEDCQTNGMPDDLDILFLVSQDQNTNGIPDECEPDCQTNGIPDDLDIILGISQDCDDSGVPDECEVSSGASPDLDANGIPDFCEDCQRNGIPDDWDLAFGISQDLNGNGLPDECEDCQPNGVPDDLDIAQGVSADLNLNGLPDECEDCQGNGLPDDLDIAFGTSPDINHNGVPDECDPDCQPNGVPDDFDIALDNSIDCNVNDVPDECEPDCNSNGVVDECDTIDGTSFDCNDDLIPDECQDLGDCSGDLVASLGDVPVFIGCLTGPDGQVILPICKCSDQDQDGDADIKDFAQLQQSFGLHADCNSNGLPDGCEISADITLDCNLNDELDQCELADGSAPDCNINNIPDDCDIFAGFSLDSNANGIPDECEP